MAFHFIKDVVYVKTGVYFLADDTEIVYCGSSTVVSKRVAEHIGKKEFTRVLAITFPSRARALSIEADFIKYLKPRLNRERFKHMNPSTEVCGELDVLIKRQIPACFQSLFIQRLDSCSPTAPRKLIIDRGSNRRLALTDEIISQLKPSVVREDGIDRPGNYEVADTVCPGLRLKVNRAGSRTFVMRRRHPRTGRMFKLTIGRYTTNQLVSGDQLVIGAPQSLTSARSLCELIQQHYSHGREPHDHIAHIKRGRVHDPHHKQREIWKDPAYREKMKEAHARGWDKRGRGTNHRAQIRNARKAAKLAGTYLSPAQKSHLLVRARVLLREIRSLQQDHQLLVDDPMGSLYGGPIGNGSGT